MVRSAYEALYKVLMNINGEQLSALWNGLGLDGDRCIRVIPQHPPFSVKEEALPACKETITREYTMVLKGLSNATDLNVLQGKAYEKPC